MSNFKWTDEKIENFISENAVGYKLIQIKRGNNNGKTRIFLTCDQDHNYDVNFENFQKGRRCPHCDGKIKLKFKDIKKFIEEDSDSNCTVLTTNYNNIDEKLNIKCDCGIIFETTFYNFKYNNKRRCNDCRNEDLSKRFRNSIEYVSKQIYSLSNGNVKLISDIYINGKTPIDLLCSCGNKFSVKFNDFLSNKQYQCPKCGIEKRANSKRFSYEDVKNDIENNGYELLSNEYISSDNTLHLKCPEGHESHMLYNNFKRGARCRQCYFNSMGGENSYNWKGGITPLHEYLRKHIKEWKNKSKESSGYRCIVTGGKFDVIHHLYPFHKIMMETINELNIPILSSINDYTEDELKKMIEKCLEIHYRYPNGVCLNNKVHYLFHSIYGKHDNTPEQFYKFVERYKNGEFNNLLVKEVV